MNTRVDVDDIEVTRGERLLAWVLAGFLLLGALWGYHEVNLADDADFRDPMARLAPDELKRLDRRANEEQDAAAARRLVRQRRAALAERREEYRTSLDEGRPDPVLERRYRRSQTRYDLALRDVRSETAQARRARAAAAPVDRKLQRIEREQAADDRRNERITAALRLALVVVFLGAALALMARLRRRRSRWMTAGYATVGAAAVLALYTGLDYLTDYLDPIDLGPLLLSVIGAAFTLIALAAFQRHLARRLPSRRVRRSECPFCGFPARGGGTHCEGCGRTVVAPCARCTQPRRVGTPHCAACGET